MNSIFVLIWVFFLFFFFLFSFVCFFVCFLFIYLFIFLRTFFFLTVETLKFIGMIPLKNLLILTEILYKNHLQEFLKQIGSGLLLHSCPQICSSLYISISYPASF